MSLQKNPDLKVSQQRNVGVSVAQLFQELSKRETDVRVHVFSDELFSLEREVPGSELFPPKDLKLSRKHSHCLCRLGLFEYLPRDFVCPISVELKFLLGIHRCKFSDRNRLNFAIPQQPTSCQVQHGRF